MQQRPLEQLTLKLDTQGRILRFQTESLRPIYAKSITKENSRSLHEITHIQDQARMQAHLKDVLQNLSAQSVPYRIRLGGSDVYVHVKAHSRLFRNSSPGECDFIMSIHTILNESELAQLESHANANHNNNNINNNNALSLPSTSQVTSHHTSMGGPLMTSVINGSVPQVQTSRSTNVVTSYSSPPAPENIFSSDSFDFSFHTDSFDMNGMETVGVGWESRPDSRASVTPVSTPRPPSVSAYSPVAAVCPSPLTTYQAGQPSPSTNNNNNNINNNNINNNNNSGYGAFSFPNFDEKDSKDHVQQHVQHQLLQQQQQQQQLQQQQQQQANHNSERLRNLLTKRPQLNAAGTGAVDAEHDQRGQNKILKGLLNAEEEKESAAAGGGGNFNKLNTANLAARMPQQRPVGNSDSKNNNGNNMLLQLLNEKSDDDDNMDGRSNQRNHSELLRQLQKDETTKEHTNTNSIGNDELIQMLRFQGNDFTNRKRPNNDTEDSPSAKRTEDKPSKLREKNKMLASLLSNPSKAPTTFTTPMVKTIPDIPQSRIPNPEQPSPQQILNNQKTPQQMVNMHQQLQHPVRSSPQVRKPSDLYLNQQMPTQPELNKNHQVSGSPPVFPNQTDIYVYFNRNFFHRFHTCR